MTAPISTGDEGEVRRGGASALRSFEAPTRPEADALAAPTISAFEAAGWTVDDQLWIPGDRRPSIGESLVLSAASEALLEANGTLRITFGNTDANAALPAVVPTTRHPDEWEALAGTRYRRLAPRWIAASILAVIGLLIVLSFARSFGLASPTPDANGYCPFGYLPVYQSGPEPDATWVPIGCSTMAGSGP
jgi:hypothetical protein